MCAVHVFGKDSMIKPSLERIVQVKYHKLAQSFVNQNPNTVIGRHLNKVNRSSAELMSGKTVFAAAGRIRKELSFNFTPIWKSCLVGDGLPPSDKDWEWVHKKTLTLIVDLPQTFRSQRQIHKSRRTHRSRAGVLVNHADLPHVGDRFAKMLAGIHASWLRSQM